MSERTWDLYENGKLHVYQCSSSPFKNYCKAFKIDVPNKTF